MTRRLDLKLAVALCAALAGAPGAALASMSGVQWLDLMQRAQNVQGHRSHVHSRGEVRDLDFGSGAVTLLHPEVASPDRGIWMPAMRMTFHVTNPAQLRHLRVGDPVEFQAALRRGGVMIVDIRPLGD